ncbi:MAG: hypothetical protein WC061_10745 [Melioribacteraceae bacterium]
MIEYRYTIFAKLFFRYGNIPLTFLLMIYLGTSVIGLFSRWYFIFFAIINLAIIIWLNKYFIKMYRNFPFSIRFAEDKLICSDFFFSDRVVEICLSDIDSITGGVFGGYPSRPTYIHDGKQNITIGFYSGSGKFNELLISILKNIEEPLYQQLIDKMKKFNAGR